MNISNGRYLELLRAEERLKEMQEIRLLEEQMPEFLNKVGTILAVTPWFLWPEFCKQALKQMPEGWRELYCRRLPPKPL